MTFLRKPEPVDVVMVGAGASGGTAAKVLTEAGLTVVGLERGPWLRPEQFSGDELKYINRTYLWQDAKLKPRTFRPTDNTKAELDHFSPTAQLVGGGTVHWNAWFPRPIVDDFRLHSMYGDIPGATLADWPLTYEELEPYYTRVEWEFGASGLAGSNAYEAPRSRGYPCPPYPLTRYGKVFHEASAKLGYNSFPLPMAVVTTPHNGRTPTVHSGFWEEYGVPDTSKSTTLTTFIPDALATGRYELRPDSYAREITLHKDGRAKAVLYLDDEGNEIEQEAGIVIVCCGGIESARLLLLSKSNLFPDGLANSSGLVGRNAMFHDYVFAAGLFDKQVNDPLYPWSGSYSNGATFEFYRTDPRRDHILGGIVAASMLGHPINWSFPGRPTWGSAAKDADRDFFNHSMAIGQLLQDLPQATNRVDLDPEVKDAWGLPVARITASPHPNDLAQGNWTADRCVELLEAAGACNNLPVYQQRVSGACSHEMGTARMGDDSSTSVLDRWGRAHDVDNLYILDGSVFPTSLGTNPTLTIMANAWRCAEYIAQQHARGRADRRAARAGVGGQ